MSHSNQVREFVLSDKGIDLVDVYIADDRVLTGTARIARETQERDATEQRLQEHKHKLDILARKRKAIEAQVAALHFEAETEASEVNFAMARQTLQEKGRRQSTKAMTQLRGGARSGNGLTREAKISK